MRYTRREYDHDLITKRIYEACKGMRDPDAGAAGEGRRVAEGNGPGVHGQPERGRTGWGQSGTESIREDGRRKLRHVTPWGRS